MSDESGTSRADGVAAASTAGPGHDHDSANWFEALVPQYPADGSGVPARADSPWGSDLTEAETQVAHRAAYAPTTPIPLAPHGGAPPDPALAQAGSWPPPTGPAEPGLGSPASSGPGNDDGGSHPPAWSQPGSSAAPPPLRRGRFWVGLTALALTCGLIGGVAGQLVNDRVHLGGSTIPEPGPGATARPPGSIAGIAAAATPSVVTIQVRGDQGSGTGSGFVIDALGHILTNNHVVDGAAAGGDIEVLLSNGETEKATIVGRDVSYDLAVLRMARKDLKPLAFGASGSVVVGDEVIAVGAPLGLEQTVTSGIVSALNRPVSPGSGDEASYINAIQTDAAINPGNSGGPLLDMSGQVIGVNSAIARVPGTNGGTGGNIGLGFAIPSDQARRTADQLIAKGKATHPVIGVLLDRSYSGAGAQILSSADAVTAGGPAAKAGIRPGDVIVGFEGKAVRAPDQLIVSIRARAVGDTVTLKVDRDGREIDLKMTLEAAPDK